MRFTKMQGAGNDYVYVDCFREKLTGSIPELAIAVSDRRFGIGSDGLILILPSDKADAQMRMFNADGSESAMCGNGIRCVAKYVYDHDIAKKEQLKIETRAGILSLDLEIRSGLVSRVCVDMGEPGLAPELIPTTLPATSLNPPKIANYPIEYDGHKLFATCISMGNPHCVIFVPEATDELVLKIGPQIENDPRFPKRTNVEFVEVLAPGEVNQRTWERGSGETWACGTGASAVCVAGVLTGVTNRRILNHLRGGDLILEWNESTNHVLMTGPAVEVFSGVW